MKKRGSKFFRFRQNNSGGTFVHGGGLDVIVVIEALDYLHANAIAQSKGVYFDGCSYGRDCSCCGDRWYELSEWDDGYPKEFGDKTLKQMENLLKKNDRYAHHFVVHYLDGRVVQSRGRIESPNADGW